MLSRLKITYSVCLVANSSSALTAHKIKWIHAGTEFHKHVTQQAELSKLPDLFIHCVSQYHILSKFNFPLYFWKDLCALCLRKVLEKARYNSENRWNLQNS